MKLIINLVLIILLTTSCFNLKEAKVRINKKENSKSNSTTKETFKFFLGANPDYTFLEPQFCFLNNFTYMTTHQGIIIKLSLDGEEIKRKEILEDQPAPYGIACDQSNNLIYTSDGASILVMDENFNKLKELTTTFGKLALDSNNDLWVYNGTDNNIYKVNTSTDTITQTIDVTPLISTDYCSFTIGPDDYFYLANYRSGSSTLYKVDSGLNISWSASGNNKPFNINYANGKIIISNYQGSQTKIFDHTNGTLLETINGTTLWTKSQRMYNSTLAPNGNYYFARRDGVYVFDSAKNLIKEYLYQGDSDYLWTSAEEVYVDEDNNYYIADYSNHKIKKYNKNREHVVTFGGSGSNDGQLASPSAVIKASNQKVYVSEWGNDRISVFDEDGNFLFKFGSTGTANNQFKNPCSLAEGNNKIYVSDHSNHAIKVYDLDGNYLDSFGSYGSSDGEFDKPCGIAVDKATDEVYVGELNNDRLQKFSSSHTHIATFGTGDADTNKNIKDPWSIVITQTRILVISSGLQALQSFSKSSLTHEKNVVIGWGAAYNNLNSPFGVAYKDGYAFVINAGTSNVKAYNVETSEPLLVEKN